MVIKAFTESVRLNTGLAKWLFSNSINHLFLILKFCNSIKHRVQPLRQARNRYRQP